MTRDRQTDLGDPIDDPIVTLKDHERRIWELEHKPNAAAATGPQCSIYSNSNIDYADGFDGPFPWDQDNSAVDDPAGMVVWNDADATWRIYPRVSGTWLFIFYIDAPPGVNAMVIVSDGSHDGTFGEHDNGLDTALRLRVVQTEFSAGPSNWVEAKIKNDSGDDQTSLGEPEGVRLTAICLRPNV